MHVGLLTARFGSELAFEGIAEWAAQAGFAALEATCGPGGHLSAPEILADGGAKVKRVLANTGLRLSSLAYYACFNRGQSPQEYSQNLTAAMRAAETLGVDVVCTLAGWPVEGKSKAEAIRELVPPVFEPLAREAEARKVRIAFENWFATLLQSAEHFEAVMAALPQKNVGFNFDPSHLHWQQIDLLSLAARCSARIFHTHAKDVFIDEARRSQAGVLERGWWRYVIPGFGRVPWGEYFHVLRRGGYNGVLSIEHEDGAFDAKEGFRLGLKFLNQFV